MKRKTNTAPTRIYSYGCRLPTANGELVEQQILLAHRYYNKLVEIERRRRDAIAQAQQAASPELVSNLAEVDAIDGQITALVSAIAAKRAATRSAKVGATEEKAAIAALKSRRRECWAAVKVAKESLKTPEMIEKFRAIGEVAYAEVRAARAECGVYWGTYLTVEAAVEAAKKSPAPPAFKRWDGRGGKVAVQMQGGISVAEAFAGDTRLQIVPPAPNRMSKVRIRVGTADDKRSPIFAEFPFRYHRDLPKDAKIKWAWIVKSMKGRWVNWDLQIVIEAESLRRDARPPSDGGVVAIDLGWRLRPGRDLRVGYWIDDRGQHGELLMPEDIRMRLDHADSIRAIADRTFNAERVRLAEWAKERTLPEWMVEPFKFLPLWKSPRRMSELFAQWKENRFDGDSDGFAGLEAWRKQDCHLRDWEACERDRALGTRRDLYRRWAADLSRRYAVVVLEDFDMREVAKLEATDSDRKDLPAPTRRNRTVAACSEFVGALKNAAANNGCTVELVESAYTTAKCSNCGHVQNFDHTKLFRLCERCGGASGPIDQDREAAANLLESWAKKGSRSQTDVKPSGSTGPEAGALEMPAQGALP